MRAIMNAWTRTVVALGCVSVAAALLGGCGGLRETMRLPCKCEAIPYSLIYAKNAPVIDGNLDDEVWQQAVRLDTFYEYEKSGVRIKDVATAWMAWDKDNLYLAATVKDKDLYVYQKENDVDLCRADAVELFLKPRADRMDLYEFQFNMWNAVCDYHYLSRGGSSERFRAWNSGAVAHSVIHGTPNDWTDVDEGWQIEIAIPMKAFVDVAPDGPKPGDTWKFNITGYDWSVYRDKYLLFTSFDNNTKGFIEHEGYPSMQFMAP